MCSKYVTARIVFFFFPLIFGTCIARVSCWLMMQAKSSWDTSWSAVSCIPHLPNQCWKMSHFFNKKRKRNHPVIKIVSTWRVELACRPNNFVWDCLKEEFKECCTNHCNKGWRKGDLYHLTGTANKRYLKGVFSKQSMDHILYVDCIHQYPSISKLKK